MKTRIIRPENQSAFKLVKFDNYDGVEEVNAENLLFNGGPNDYANKLFCICGPFGNFSHCYGYIWANYESEALENAADLGLLDSLLMDEEETKKIYSENREDEYLTLGNAGEFFDGQELHVTKIPASVWKADFDFAYALGRAAENPEIERWSDL